MPAENADIWWLQWKMFIACLFLSYLVYVPSFKSVDSSSLSRKKYDGDNFTPTSCKWLRGQNTLVGIGLIELTDPSDTLNYKPFLNIAFYKLFYVYFYCSYLRGTKSFVLKTELYLTFFWFGLGWHSLLQYELFCVSGAFFISL